MAFPFSYGAFGRDTGRIVLHSITCNGSPSRLVDCTYNLVQGYSSGGCTLSEDAGIRCYGVLLCTTMHTKSITYFIVLWFISVPSSCTTGTITLMDGRSGMEGRVEMCRGGVWGAVYDDYGWNFNDAQVTCQQMGYPSNCELTGTTHF